MHRGWKDPADLEERDRIPGDKDGRETDLNSYILFSLFFTFKKFDVKKNKIKYPSEGSCPLGKLKVCVDDSHFKETSSRE